MKSRSFNLLVILALFLSLLGSAVTVTPAYAANFSVNNAASLIAAINTANTNNLNDTITLTANITLTAIDNGNNGLPVILADNNHSLTIEGNGFAISRSSAGGTPNFRILEVGVGNVIDDPILTLNNITLSNGYADDGGGISNYGTLTIMDSTLSGNNAVSIDISSAYGGAIINSGTLTIQNSTFTGNSATSLSNSGALGGAIHNGGGAVTIINSTFSDNHAIDNGSGGGHGGAVTSSSTLTIKNSTFSGNSTSDSIGGIDTGGTLYLENSILANNTANGVGSDCSNFGTLATNINNLIENNNSLNPCGVPSLTADPNLGPLQDNGGPTHTMALLPGSPAIDAGNNTVCTTSPVSGLDQRGTTRPQGSTCDIGAYEVLGGIPIVIATNPSANAVLTSLSSITVVFNQDMLDNATANGAENVNNYLLVERGANGSFNTVSCNGGVVSDDVKQTISTASYNSTGFITSLTLASPLAAGTYRLFVCGTTSVWSVAGLELNNGVNDYTVDFTITSTAGTGNTGNRANTVTASSLPKTGFAPGKVTTLPAQPAALEYAELGDLWLEIPSLNVKSTIVGVPQNADKTWDVSWLGNDTGWLNGTAFPTWTGNSVLTAHVTNASGLEGPFAALKSLQYGDQVIVHFGGVKYVYEVRATKLSRPYATNYAFESKQDASYLTLITCQGYNPLNESYLFRRVVRAVLIEVK
jgi:LPXTG-site transpeptidase (sortase) family protein